MSEAVSVNIFSYTPLSPAKATFLSELCNPITRQAIELEQWFPTCLDLRHPAEENYILRHPVANPYNFASRFDDSLKMYF